MKKRILFSLDPEVINSLRKLAQITGLKMTTIVEKALLEYIKNK